MAYVRKTEDEYQIHTNYGHGSGWEHELSEDTYSEALQRVKEYRQNAYGLKGIKIIKKRVKK